MSTDEHTGNESVNFFFLFLFVFSVLFCFLLYSTLVSEYVVIKFQNEKKKMRFCFTYTFIKNILNGY